MPAKLNISSTDGSLVVEKAISVGPTGWKGSVAVGVNAKSASFVVSVAELFSGIIGTATTAAAPSVRSIADQAAPSHTPPDMSFGMHFKSIVATGDGSTLALNAFNMDQNLFGLDAATGAVTWRQRIGHYWSFAPTASADGTSFAVQAFDLNNANGMQLYAGIDPKTGKPMYLHSISLTTCTNLLKFGLRCTITFECTDAWNDRLCIVRPGVASRSLRTRIVARRGVAQSTSASRTNTHSLRATGGWQLPGTWPSPPGT